MAFSGQSNPPWLKNAMIPNISNMIPPQNSGIIPFPQNSQVFSHNTMDQQAGGGQSLPYIGTMFNVPSYLQTRGGLNLNPMAFQNPSSNRSIAITPPNQTMSAAMGTVTKVNHEYGLINDEIFFHINVCQGGKPKIGDSVAYNANFNPNTQFKWSASRVQSLKGIPNLTVIPLKRIKRIPTEIPSQNIEVNIVNTSVQPIECNEYPQQLTPVTLIDKGNSPLQNQSPDRSDRFESRERKDFPKQKSQENSSERCKQREDDEKRDSDRRIIRERQNQSAEKRDRSPVVRRPSPKKRRPVVIQRYAVNIPKMRLTILNADVQELRRRYLNLYIPSDFFFSDIKWTKAFLMNQPFSIQRPCAFHIMHKSIDPPESTQNIIEPTDSDYIFSARVMLMGSPALCEIYDRCLHPQDDYEDIEYVHPSRLINFLVGRRGNETMAIGGAWSRTLDGENPESDASVLIKTAIRTCKALTGIDLSNCTQWYRFLELYYHRAEHTRNGKFVPSRVETVVIYLTDIHSCMPTSEKWIKSQQTYKAAMDTILNRDQGGRTHKCNTTNNNKAALDDTPSITPTLNSRLEEETADVPENTTGIEKSTNDENYVSSSPTSKLIAESIQSGKIIKLPEKESSEFVEREFVVIDDDDDQADDNFEVDMNDIMILDEYDESKTQEESNSSKKEEKVVLSEKDREQIERRYVLPLNPHIIVHPSKTAKSGKFNCSVMSLSVLLDYSITETKERSFEVSLFVELFNEMLMRDFGFNIFKDLWIRNEKAKKTLITGDGKKPDDFGSQIIEPEKFTSVQNEIKNDKLCSRVRKTTRRSDDMDHDRFSIRLGEKRKRLDKRMPAAVCNPELLLSYIYFDTTHWGYIFENDLEHLFNNIGLNLSRRQIRNLLSPFTTRDSLYYRQFTDKEDIDSLESFEDYMNDSDEEQLTNSIHQNLLPVFFDSNVKTFNSQNETNGTSQSNGIINYNGALVDVGKMFDQIRRLEKANVTIERKLNELCKTNSILESGNLIAGAKIEELQSEVNKLTDKLSDADADVLTLTEKYKDQHSILSNIYEKVFPLFERQEANIKPES